MKRNDPAPFALILLLACATAASPARAQSWIVVPVTTGELEDGRLAVAAEAALSQRGQEVVARSALPDLGSASEPIPSDLRERLLGAPQPALEDAAFGRRARVLERTGPLLEEIGRYLDALGRAPDVARAVADLALIAARAHAEGRDEPAARATVERLLSLVPTPDPTVDFHPHETLALLSHQRTRLRDGAATAELRVEESEGGACNVYLNGQLSGPTPLALPLYAGDYAVRLQCGELRSRVHRVHVDTGPTTLRIAASLEAAFHDRPRWHLRYADASSMASRAHEDVSALATLTGAARALLLRLGGAEARVEVVQVAGGGTRVERTATVPRDADGGALDEVWAAVLDGSAVGGSDAPASRGSEWNIVIGASLVGLGAVALISPFHTLAREGECTDAPMPGYCKSAITFGAQSGTLLALGLAAIAGGVVWWIVEPLRVSVSAEPTSARLFIGGSF